MKFNTALTLKEETVRNCLHYFTKIYGRPLDLNQASNRRYEAEKETGYGKPYYEKSDKKTFFKDLNVAIGTVKDAAVKARFTDYLKAYIKNSPEDGYICGSEQDKRNEQKFNQTEKEREAFRDQTTKTYNSKLGLYNHEMVNNNPTTTSN